MSSSSSSVSSTKGSSRRRIYITGYSSKEDPHDIKKLFKKYGKIEEFSWKGKFCFIQYEEADDAVKAAKKMHKEEFNDYTLIVEVARSQKRSDGACYACGKKGHFARNCRYRKSVSSSREKKKSKHKKHKKKKSSTSSSSSRSSSSEKRKKKKLKSKAKSKSKKRRESSSKSRSRSREKSDKSKSSSKSSDSGKKSKDKDKSDDKSNNGKVIDEEKSTKGKAK